MVLEMMLAVWATLSLFRMMQHLSTRTYLLLLRLHLDL